MYASCDNDGDQPPLLEQRRNRLKRKDARSSREDEDHGLAEKLGRAGGAHRPSAHDRLSPGTLREASLRTRPGWGVALGARLEQA
jgi:hypothetical protein